MKPLSVSVPFKQHGNKRKALGMPSLKRVTPEERGRIEIFVGKSAKKLNFR